MYAINLALFSGGLPTIDPFSSVCDRLGLRFLGLVTLVRSVRDEFVSAHPMYISGKCPPVQRFAESPRK